MTRTRKRLLSEAISGVQQKGESPMARSSVALLLEYDKIASWLLQQPEGETVGIACFEAPEYDFRHALGVLALYLYDRLHTHIYVRESGWHLPRKDQAETPEVHPLPPVCAWFVRLLNCMAAGQAHGQAEVSREVALAVLKTVQEMVDCRPGTMPAG